MTLTNDVIEAILVLSPGFLSLIILEILITREKVDTFRFVVEGVILSWIIYATTGFIMPQVQPPPSPGQDAAVTTIAESTETVAPVEPGLPAEALPVGLTLAIQWPSSRFDLSSHCCSSKVAGSTFGLRCIRRHVGSCDGRNLCRPWRRRCRLHRTRRIPSLLCHFVAGR